MLDRLTRDRRRAARAARDRRYRQRVKACKAVYRIEGDAELLDTLVKLHWIGEEELTDKRAVERAIGAMLKSVRRDRPARGS